jgi:NAD(P)-dependent dehydrogenase (short-subunit alcohol dehydrogenase family)
MHQPGLIETGQREAIMAQQFGATSTTEDVLAGIDLKGKRILVTGASAGLGVETVRALASHGAEVIGTVRDVEKGQHATAGIPGITLLQMDLASLASVRAAADKLVAEGKPLDLIIANAGIMACPKSFTADGFEMQFGTNHLGHFVFVNRIASLLQPGGRLVNLASSGHRFSDVNLEDPNFEATEYTPFGAYGRSKTANILFAVEFDRRHKARGVRGVAVHPGGIQTELGRHLGEDMIAGLIAQLNENNRAAGLPPFQWKTIPQGAATSVWAGVRAPADEVGGLYCEDCHIAEPENNDQAMRGVRAYALDPDNARALWAKSEEMVGEVF